jgi:hypothetical protein
VLLLFHNSTADMRFVTAAHRTIARTCYSATIVLLYAVAVAAASAVNAWLPAAVQPQALLHQQLDGVTRTRHAQATHPSSSNAVLSVPQQLTWQPAPNSQHLLTPRNRRTLQQQQQQSSNVNNLTMPPVNYAYSAHNSTELSHLVPGFDTHGMGLTRFVVSAWSISNFSTPEILTESTAHTVQQLIAAYLNVSAAQVRGKHSSVRVAAAAAAAAAAAFSCSSSLQPTSTSQLSR